MARIFDSEQSLVPTWLAAARFLHSRSNDEFTDRNVVLEVADPVRLAESDRLIVRKVDQAIRMHRKSLSIETVAGTIFPEGLYRRYGRPDFYQRFFETMQTAKKPGTWGTYAMRLFKRRAAHGDGSINPLDIIVEKLKRAASDGNKYRSAYEAGLIDPGLDLLDPSLEFGCELPTYEPATDARLIRNMPCLSHLSFKLADAGTAVDLTAIYRSHHYCERALGNLIGLSRLQAFVAKEAGIRPGVLTCVSTHARLDVDCWGGKAAAQALLNEFPR